MGVKEPCPPLGVKTAFHRKLGKGGSKKMMAPSMDPLLIREAYKQTQTSRPYQRKILIQGYATAALRTASLLGVRHHPSAIRARLDNNDGGGRHYPHPLARQHRWRSM